MSTTATATTTSRESIISDMKKKNSPTTLTPGLKVSDTVWSL